MRFKGGVSIIAATAVALLHAASVSSAPDPSAQALPASLLFHSDFEAGALNEAQWGVSGNAPTITTEVVRKGKYAVQTHLDRFKSKKSYRTELEIRGTRTKPGVEYWYGFSVYLPHDYVADPIWEIVAQWHATLDEDLGELPGSVNPPLSLHSENGEWMISTIWDSRQITSKENYEGKKRYQLGKYTTGKWTDWVFHIKWLPTKDGILQVWQDSKLVVDKKGPIGFKDRVGPYFKMGLYKGWETPTRVGVATQRTLYHDEFRMAGPEGSYDDVAPGGKARRPAAPVAVRLE